MKRSIAVYHGETVYDATLLDGQTLTIGSGKDDSILLPRLGLLPAHITVTAHPAQVQIASAEPVLVGSVTATRHILSPGEILRAGRKVSVAVFEEQRNTIKPVPLHGHREISIGRSSRRDISLGGMQVSSGHAMLRKKSNGWEIEDLRSRNGTFVNGKRVASKLLKDNDVLFIGGWKIRYKGEKLHFESMPGALVFSSRLRHGASAQNTSSPQNAEYPYFQRTPRLKPVAETKEMEILQPPSLSEKPSISWLSVLLPPLLMMSVMMTISMITGNMIMLLYTVPMSAASILIAFLNHRTQTSKWTASADQAETKYEAYLRECEAEITLVETKLLQTLTMINPSINECMGIATRLERRLWERTATDEDFLTVRIGTGTAPSNVMLKTPRAQMELAENPLLAEVGELCERHAVLHGVPVTVPLAESKAVGLVGARDAVQKCVWSLVVGLATHHSYEDVKIVLVFPEREYRQWGWIRWLPHTWDDSFRTRMIACTADAAAELLRQMDDILKLRQRNDDEKQGAQPVGPHYVFILADKYLAELASVPLSPDMSSVGATFVYAYGEIELLPGECQTIISCNGQTGSLQHKDQSRGYTAFSPDTVTLSMMDTFARSLAPVRLRSLSKKAAMPDYVPLLAGLGARNVESLDILARWSRSRPFERIAAPIGVRDNGEVFAFDIHEKGMGPHGIVAGATRWGKSETLTTWLLSVALHYHPQEVSFVLIDFKGDGLSGILMDLPHVAGKISNVNDMTDIERNLRSLQGELLRRQRVFMETKKENIHKYQEAYRNGQVREPMPYLIIVIDEFAELKTQFPDQMNGFISIARVGGSLGVYMVLATQSPGGGIVSGQVSANSRFRICLKTAEAGESKDILGTTDAYKITTRGRAYVKVGNNEVYEQVQTFFSKAPYRFDTAASGTEEKLRLIALDGQRVRPDVYDKTIGVAANDLSEGRAIAQYIQQTVAKAGIPPARQVWTEALPERIALSDLLHPGEVFHAGRWPVENEGFSVPAGLVDNPEEQRQYPFVFDFVEDGHQVIYGAPQSGKTELLRTAILSAAMRYTPEQVQFVALDFGAWGLKLFEALPHTLLVAEGSDAQKIKKAEEFLLHELASRKWKFSEQGVSTLEAYRDVSGESLAYLLIVVDNMASLYSLYPDLLDTLTTLAREGGGLGTYLLMTSGNQSGFMYRLSQYIKCSCALQMTDKSEYRQLFGGNGKMEPKPLPGRGFVKGPLEFQTALCVDAAREGERVKQLRALCAAISDAWQGAKPGVASILSDTILLDTLHYDQHRVQIGIEKLAGKPYDFVFGEMNGCVIAGPPKSGKTNALCCLVRALSSDDATTVYLYEKGSRLQAMHGRAKCAQDGAAFDLLMAEVLAQYLSRSQGGKGGPRIVLCIDDFITFYDEIADETADVLDLVIRDGAQRGIYTYIAGDRDGLTRFFNLSVHVFASCLSNGNALALGGKLREYSMFNALHEEQDTAIGKHEGYVLHAGKALALKIACAKEDASNA